MVTWKEERTREKMFLFQKLYFDRLAESMGICFLSFFFLHRSVEYCFWLLCKCNFLYWICWAWEQRRVVQFKRFLVIGSLSFFFRSVLFFPFLICYSLKCSKPPVFDSIRYCVLSPLIAWNVLTILTFSFPWTCVYVCLYGFFFILYCCKFSRKQMKNFKLVSFTIHRTLLWGVDEAYMQGKKRPEENS